MLGALCGDVHATALPGLRRRAHDDLDIPAQRIEKVDEPLRGEATEPAAEEVRDFGLINAHQGRRVLLRQRPFADHVVDQRGELRLWPIGAPRRSFRSQTDSTDPTRPATGSIKESRVSSLQWERR